MKTYVIVYTSAGEFKLERDKKFYADLILKWELHRSINHMVRLSDDIMLSTTHIVAICFREEKESKGKPPKGMYT